MKIDPRKLVSFGYLPKELPPVFSSRTLGDALNSINLPKLTDTKCVDFSIPKGRYSRRKLQVPHPFNFIQLVKHLSHPSNWSMIRQHNNKCTFSTSFVQENDDERIRKAISSEDSRALKYRYSSFRESRKAAILAAFDKLFVVELDISQYYPSIYTHTLTWALLGRTRAKEFLRLKPAARTAEADFDLYDFADKLDRLIRSAQENQSVGLPIGPDTSHIISEIIGCYFDQRLSEHFPGIRAFRYFDDYEILVESEEKAQEVLRFAQEILAEFQLSISENKATIYRFPFELEEEWVKEISLAPTHPTSENNLRRYFSSLFGLLQRFPTKGTTIVKYSLRTYERLSSPIRKNDWAVFEALLLKTALVAPGSLEIVSRILETYRRWVNPKNVDAVMVNILKIHAPLNHHFETVWALWGLKQFKRVLPRFLVEPLIDSNNPFVILMLLDLEHSGLVEGGRIDPTLRSVISNSLDSNEDKADWLLFYEGAMVKKWLTSTGRPDLQTLLDNDVSFYDTSASMKTYPAGERPEDDVKRDEKNKNQHPSKGDFRLIMN